MALANFVMRGRLQAILMTVFFAVLSFGLAPLSVLSAAVVSLVTLRLGPYPGFVIIASSTTIMIVLTYLLSYEGGGILVFAGVVWLPVWLLSIVLRKTISLPITLYVTGSIAMLVPIIFYTLFDNPSEWWKNILDGFLNQALGQTEIAAVASLMTSILAVSFLLGLLLSVFLGRWWQAKLYNPGEFYQEFINLRFNKVAAGLTLGLLLMSMMVQQPSVLVDLTFVGLALCGVPGIALAHSWVHHTQANKSWLVGLYVLLFIISWPVTVMLAMLTISDTWMNYRRYYLKF